MTPPAPDPAFHWTAEAWGHALRCRPLSAIAQHAFTTKQLRLRAASPEEQLVAWTRATASVGADLEQLMHVRQVHGASVRVLKKGETRPADAGERPRADALISNAPGLVLSVQVADCVPVLIADPKTSSVAAVHAGWRGTCAGVARAAVNAMAREFGVNPADLSVAIGPSIGPCCYEVGTNVIDAFRLAGANEAELARWFAHTKTGSLRLDLWAVNRDQLLGAGVQDDHIYVCRLCTQTHRDIFESDRADGEQAGRMAAMIAVP
jgi:YfiH family protein